MQLISHEKGAAPSPKFAAPLDIELRPDSNADDAGLEALRHSFSAFGMTVYRLVGEELAITGPGLCRSLPDHRCARIYLRQLRGAC